MTPWPASILPQNRDARWNHLATGIAVLYRAFRHGEAITSMTVTVRGEDGERVIRYPAVITESQAVELEYGSEERAC